MIQIVNTSLDYGEHFKISFIYSYWWIVLKMENFGITLSILEY